MNRIEVTGTPDRKISPDEFAKAIGAEAVSGINTSNVPPEAIIDVMKIGKGEPFTGDNVKIVAGLTLYHYDYQFGMETVVVAIAGPNVSKFVDKSPSGYEYGRNKSFYSTPEAAKAGYDAQQAVYKDELSNKMTDRKGNVLEIGDRVYVHNGIGGTVGPGYIRAFGVLFHKVCCRVDNGAKEDTDIKTSQTYTWSSWCHQDTVEKI